MLPQSTSGLHELKALKQSTCLENHGRDRGCTMQCMHAALHARYTLSRDCAVKHCSDRMQSCDTAAQQISHLFIQVSKSAHQVAAIRTAAMQQQHRSLLHLNPDLYAF